jgi:Holliday junction resolvase-like predicted endonuclease
LLGRGYDLLGRNIRLKAGEIDLVYWDHVSRQLVLVEVKAGRHEGAYRPERHIDGRKRRTLGQLKRAMARQHGLRRGRVRVDVVAVQYAQRCERSQPRQLIEQEVRHYRGLRVPQPSGSRA